MAEQSLFGATPEALQASRADALQAQALQYAKLDPFQRATMGIYQGANQLGGAIGGMLGGQDPEMMRIKQRQQLLQGVNTTDAASLIKAAQRANEMGDYPAAQELFAKAQSIQSTAIKQGLDTSTTAANLATAVGRQFDVSPEGRGQELAKTGKFTSESIAKFVAGTGQLEAIDKLAKPDSKFIAKAVALGFGDKSNYGSYTAEQAAKVNTELFNEDLKLKATGAPRTVIPLGDVFNKIATTKDAENKQAAWKTAGESYTLAVPLLSKLDELYNNLPQTYTGNLAGITVQLGKSLSALGVPVNVSKLSNSEYAEAVGAEVVQSIARNFPGSQSNVELQQLIKSKFNILQELPTIRRILTDVRTKTQAGILTYEQLSKKPEEDRYRSDPNLLNGTNYKKLDRLNKLMNKSVNKTITSDEITEAKKLQEELK